MTELFENGDDKVRGVFRPCVLNDLTFFHTMDNWINDVMHTVNEGIIPCDVGCSLHSILREEPSVILELINYRIEQVFLNSIVEKKTSLLHSRQ